MTYAKTAMIVQLPVRARQMQSAGYRQALPIYQKTKDLLRQVQHLSKQL